MAPAWGSGCSLGGFSLFQVEAQGLASLALLLLCGVNVMGRREVLVAVLGVQWGEWGRVWLGSIRGGTHCLPCPPTHTMLWRPSPLQPVDEHCCLKPTGI